MTTTQYWRINGSHFGNLEVKGPFDEHEEMRSAAAKREIYEGFDYVGWLQAEYSDGDYRLLTLTVHRRDMNEELTL